MKRELSLLLVCIMHTSGVEAASLKTLPKNPFSYDLGVKVIRSTKKQEVVTMCCHGYGHNATIVDWVNAQGAALGTLVGFNFPDYNCDSTSNAATMSYGSPAEIMPLLYLLHYYACTLNIKTINLYGFSAGGSAVINAIAYLVRDTHDDALKKIGITREHKKNILTALRAGMIILDCPLKSVEEIIASRGSSAQFDAMARRYAAHQQNPIDVLSTLQHLNMHVILYFENPDMVLGNRDDNTFFTRLRAANGRDVIYLTGSSGGHSSHHKKLWDYVIGKNTINSVLSI